MNTDTDMIADSLPLAHQEPSAVHEPLQPAPAQSEPVQAAAVLPPIDHPTFDHPTSGQPGQGERIGRFTRAELEAMRGRRGRKPSEYHTLFPHEQGKTSAVSSPAKAASPAKAHKRGPKIPAVSSVIIGEHTIDELLEMIGSTGRKPVAYTILQEAAQVFADLRAVTLPRARDEDPLAMQLAAAPKHLRDTIALLLATAKAKAR